MFKPNRREAQKKMQETEINQNPITRVGTRDLHPKFSSTFVISAGRERGSWQEMQPWRGEHPVLVLASSEQ